jgi:hypothetical protein
MRHPARLLCLTLLLAFSVPALLHPSPGGRVEAQDLTPLPFHDLAERVTDRYEGRLLAAEIDRPTEMEQRLGTRLVYEFRLMTAKRNLLNIRMDAQTGRFLEVAGRGQIEAQRNDKDDD